MSGSAVYLPARRVAAVAALVLVSSLAVLVLGGLALSRLSVSLETANYPYTANVSGGVAVRMGPGEYTVVLRWDEGVSGEARICCAPAGPGAGQECVEMRPGVPVTLACEGPGLVVCYNATVPPMHPRVGVVEVVKAWP